MPAPSPQRRFCACTQQLPCTLLHHRLAREFNRPSARVALDHLVPLMLPAATVTDTQTPVVFAIAASALPPHSCMHRPFFNGPRLPTSILAGPTSPRAHPPALVDHARVPLRATRTGNRRTLPTPAHDATLYPGIVSAAPHACTTCGACDSLSATSRLQERPRVLLE